MKGHDQVTNIEVARRRTAGSVVLASSLVCSAAAVACSALLSPEHVDVLHKITLGPLKRVATDVWRAASEAVGPERYMQTAAAVHSAADAARRGAEAAAARAAAALGLWCDALARAWNQRRLSFSKGGVVFVVGEGAAKRA